MDNKMIERCVRALNPKACDDFKNNPIGSLERGQAMIAKSAAKIDVLAIIKAMREPTKKMLAIDAPDMPAGGDVKEIWQSMIDAVIND